MVVGISWVSKYWHRVNLFNEQEKDYFNAQHGIGYQLITGRVSSVGWKGEVKTY